MRSIVTDRWVVRRDQAGILRYAQDDNFLGRKRRVASGEENKEQERFLAAWADILAGAMMKEKAPAHFARNDGRREGGRRGMEREHDESCPTRAGKNERREKQGDVEGLAGFAIAW